MDEKYRNNIKWIRIGGIIIALGLLGFGAARLFMAGDIFSLGEFGLLGLSTAVMSIGLSSKMEHDLNREEKEDGTVKDDIEHDIGF